MYRNKRILAMIPARGGSKEIPLKNIRHVGGKPLIAWTIEAARASQYVDRVIVSTDNDRVAQVARDCGADVPFMRTSELSNDNAPITAPALHAVEQLPDYDYLLTLQPTTPFRTAIIIDTCLEFTINRGATACASITEPAHKPYWMYRIKDDGTIDPLMKEQYPSRQLFPKYYTLNGAIYLVEIAWFKKTKSFITPETTGFIMTQRDSVDIDSDLDLEIADYLLRKYRSA